MSHNHTHPKDLPVYCIGNFTEARHGSRPEKHFEIQRIESLYKSFKSSHSPHRHDFYNILVFTEGSGIHVIDFVEYSVEPCSIFFLTPGQVHALNISEDARGFSLFFDPEFYLIDRPSNSLRELPFFHSAQNEPKLKVNCEEERYIKNTLQEMMREQQGRDDNRLAVIRNYLELLTLKLSRFYSDKQKQEPQQHSPYFINLMNQFDKLIDKHFRETRSVQFYADQLCVTPKNLSAIAKKIYNKTSRELIQERVILEAKRLLLHSDMNMMEISQTLNLYDPSYFVKFFKKSVGQTPQQFRMRS